MNRLDNAATPAITDAAAAWNNRFRQDEYVFGTKPNAWLRRHAGGWKPGRRVLCVADVPPPGIVADTIAAATAHAVVEMLQVRNALDEWNSLRPVPEYGR